MRPYRRLFRSRRADQSRFEALALPLIDSAHNLAYWIVGNRFDAEDVVQEAYLRAFNAFAGFQGEEMRPWLLTIVRNTAYKLLNDRKKADAHVSSLHGASDVETTDVMNQASSEANAEQRLLIEVERQALFAALGRLPEAFREVLVLREFDELSYADIAAVTNTPVGTVMSRLSRSRTLLRQLLNTRPEDEA